jgi:hypothetical protein
MKKETEKKIEELCEQIECNIDLTDEAKQALLDKIKEVLVCEANDIKLGKLDLYRFTSDYNGDPNWMHGVFYHEGYLYVTNKFIMLRAKRDYQEAFEGKVVLKDGSVVENADTEAVFKKYTIVLNGYTAKVDEMADYDMDFDQFKKCLGMAKAHQKIYKKSAMCQIKLGDTHVSTFEFEKFCNAMSHFGVDTFKIGAADRPIVAQGDEFTMLLMPMLPLENGEAIQVQDMSPWWY